MLNFNQMCERHDLTVEEKEAVKQILKVLNGMSGRTAIDLLDFSKLVIENVSKVSVDVE